MTKVLLKKLALCFGIFTGFITDSIQSMELEKKTEMKGNQPDYYHSDNNSQPINMVFFIKELRGKIFFNLNEKDRDNLLLTTSYGYPGLFPRKQKNVDFLRFSC